MVAATRYSLLFTVAYGALLSEEQACETRKREHLGLLQRTAALDVKDRLSLDEEFDGQLGNLVRRAVGRGGQAFEGCSGIGKRDAPLSAHNLEAKLTQPVVTEGSACTGAQMALTKLGVNEVSTSCCDVRSVSCGGCEEVEGGQCVSCAGGFSLESGRCSMCVDTAGWRDDKNSACFQATCSDTMIHGVSSNQACCKCGGGQRAATPFTWQAVNLLLGATEITSGFPTPRTATKYSVDSECPLDNHGLTLNGETGELMLAPGCASVGCGKKKPFQVSCTITAHQTPEMNATAELKVSASAFAYPTNMLVARPEYGTFAPIANLSYPRKACVPSDAEKWLALTNDGTLVVEEDFLNVTTGGLSGGADLGVLGARCTVFGKLDGEDVSTSVSIFSPRTWQSFNYPRSTLEAATGETTLPQNLVAPKAELSLLAPGRYSAACNLDSESLQFSFDRATGVATVDGHTAFTLDTASGALQVAPSESLVDALDNVVLTEVARKTLTMTCRVYGHYKDPRFDLPERYVASAELTIRLRDSTCWVKQLLNFSSFTEKGSAGSPQDCAKVCRAAPDCAFFEFKNAKCYFMNGLCSLGEQCAVQTAAVYNKVPNCGERTTCMKIEDGKQKWISGDYCPVGDTELGPVYHKMGSTVEDTLFLTKYDEIRDGQHDTCAPGLYVLKQSSPKKDFSDPNSAYIELKGATVKCIEGKGTPIPTPVPTPSPTLSPTDSPTLSPTLSPTESPTLDPTDSPTLSPTDSPTEEPQATCDADFGATRNVCASKENPSVNWHGMAGGSEKHYFGNTYNKASCAQKCKDFGQSGCCEFRGSGVCVFKVDGLKRYSSGHSDAQTMMCRPVGEATCDADFGATRNVCASKENPSVNWHGMAGGSEKHYFGNTYNKASCAQKCKDFGQAGCCEYRGSGVCVFKVDGLKRYSSGHSDAQTLMCSPAAEASVSFLGAKQDVEDFVAKVFSDGRFITNVKGELEGLPCGAPNTTVNSPEGEDDEGGVPALILDDPSTPEPEDHWLHPCQCFPETWSAAPVSQESLIAIPPGSGNVFNPMPVEIVMGSFACEEGSLIDGRIVFEGEVDGQDITSCETYCAEKLCSFFWEGEVSGSKQCRLYSKCETLVREAGSQGVLKAVARDKQYCRVADPTKCWAVSGRRAFLRASSPDSVGKRVKGCAWLYLYQQCDQKLMLGAAGVDACGRCEYREAENMKFAHKKPLPERFVHGERLGVSCWTERYRSVPLQPGVAKTTESLTCVSGIWLDSAGNRGLSQFACGGCIQVVGAPFGLYAKQNKQELYFLKNMEVSVRAMLKTNYGVTSSGQLKKDDKSPFLIQTSKQVSDTMRLLKSNDEGSTKCLEFAEKGLVGGECAEPTPIAQLFKVSAMPVMLEKELVDSKVVPAGGRTESSKDWESMTMGDLKFTQDCGQHALKEFGFSDTDNDKKIEISAECTLAATLGSPQTYTEEVGGELDLEFLTCGNTWSDTADRILYTVNDGSQKQLGSTGRAKGQKDKITISYKNHFRNIKIWGSAADGWEICAMRAGGRELPTESLSTSFPILPCYIDSDATVRSENGCVTTIGMWIYGNRMPQELAGVRISCQAGSVLSYIETNGDKFVYKCVAVSTLGTCRAGQTPQSDFSSGKFDALKNQKVVCNDGSMLQSMNAEASIGGKWLRYRYYCCSSSGVPMALTPTGRFVKGIIQSFEGIYCPVRRDDSGRLAFDIAYAFNDAPEDALQDMPTPAPTLPVRYCVVRLSGNKVLGPYSSVTDARTELNKQTGSWSNRQMVCEMGLAGAKADPHKIGGLVQNEAGGFNKYWGGWDDIKKMNSLCESKCNYQAAANLLSEQQAMEASSATLSYDRDSGRWCAGSTCVVSHAAHPLEAGLTDEHPWQAAPFKDFNGLFQEGGVPAPEEEPKERKKPELITFGATQPEYAPECKDEVMPASKTFNVAAMNEIGLELPDGNPCKLVAGGWEVDGDGNMQGFGTSYWTTHAYNDEDGVEHGAGTTYDSVRGCADREISRALAVAHWDYDQASAEGFMGVAQTLFGMACGFLPDMQVAPMGFGVEMELGDICSNIVENGFDIAGFMIEQYRTYLDWGIAKDDNADCNSLQHGFSRIFCDLHCIRDAVRAGDKAILTSLEGAVKVVGQNTDLLLDYYYGVAQDKLALLKEEEEESEEESLLAQARETSHNLKAMFTEMKNNLAAGASFSPEAKATTTRALNSFAGRFGRPEILAGLAANSSADAAKRLRSLAQEAEALQATVRMSSSAGAKTPTAAQTARRSAQLLAQMQQVLQTRLYTLGVYRDSIGRAKEQMRRLARSRVATAADLVDEIRESSATAFLLDLDSTWWALRSSIDNYVELAAEQAESYGSAFSLLDAYTTSCSAGFDELQKAYRHTLATEGAAHAQLRTTYGEVTKALGILAAKIEDGNEFQQLARLDVGAVSGAALGANRSIICSGSDDAAALAAASAALTTAFQDGLVEQTWSQMRMSFMEVPMLIERFKAGGMRAPDVKWATQAWYRIARAYKTVLDGRSELTQEWMQRIRRTEC